MLISGDRQVTHPIGDIGNCSSTLNVVQSPSAASLRYQFPAKDTVCEGDMSARHLGDERFCLNIPSARYILAVLRE